jgi:sulfate permease, SulP family
VRCFLINAEGVFYADTTAVEKLDALRDELESRGATLAIARANAPLRETLERAGLTQSIGPENLFPSVRTGVRAYLDANPGSDRETR